LVPSSPRLRMGSNSQLSELPLPTELRHFGTRFDVGWSELMGRRPSQEDALCICGKIGPPSLDISLFGLFDGHAMRYAASFCAANLASILEEKLPEKDHDPTLLQDALTSTFYSLHQALQDDINSENTPSKTHPKLKYCGSTGVVVLFAGNSIFVANVGDTRAVLFRGKNNVEMVGEGDHRAFGMCSPSSVLRLSEDHKPETEVERIRAAGGHVIKNRVDGVLGVSRSIGDFFMYPKVICQPTISHFLLHNDDDIDSEIFILLCCDGVWDELSDDQACSIVFKALKDGRGLHKASAVLRDYAYFLGSDDNITAMVIRVKS